jgi:hypothetical protein
MYKLVDDLMKLVPGGNGYTWIIGWSLANTFVIIVLVRRQLWL